MVVDAVSDNIHPSTSASRGMIVNTGQFPGVDEAQQDFSYVLPSTPTSSHSPSKDYVYPVQRFFTLSDPHSGLEMLSATPSFDLCKGSGLSTEQQTIISGSQITQIYNCRVIRGHALDFDEVWFQNGRIINPALLYGLRGPDVRIDAQGLIVAPGLVDVQLNGAFGYDFSFNLDDIDEYFDEAFYGLICDGIHVHSNAVKIAYNSHPAGAVLVTDAMGAMGLPDGQYKLGNMTVDVGPLADMKDNTRAAVIQGTSTLAGSIITLIECVRKFKEFTQCSLVEAIEAATLHPAQMLGIEHRKGTLEYGADADIIFLTDDLQVERVFVRGELATPETVGN
ncbi:N-acetyl-glucosamine-6-phosphate deacetylase [Coemansia sp. RSA 1199]|nr:N-acetyl-glucosamine-6-phosphate deacetylase [Coemansia sp. RSA 1199]